MINNSKANRENSNIKIIFDDEFEIIFNHISCSTLPLNSKLKSLTYITNPINLNNFIILRLILTFYTELQ